MDPDDAESTRAELCGMLALHTIIKLLCDNFNLHRGEVNIYADNQDSLCVNSLDYNHMSFPRFFCPNVDIKMQIQAIRTSLPKQVKIYPQHVNGHLDDEKDFSYDEAPQQVQINIDVDEMCDPFLKHNQGKLEPTTMPLMLPNQKASIQVQGIRIQNNAEHHIMLHFFGPKLENRHQMKHVVSTQQMNNVNWISIERPFLKKNIVDKLPIFNLLHNK